jgi:hypothetical protein
METDTDMKLLYKIINCFPFQQYNTKQYCLFPSTFNYRAIMRQLKHIDKSFYISYKERSAHQNTPLAINDCLMILKRHLEIKGYYLIDVKRQQNDFFFFNIVVFQTVFHSKRQSVGLQYILINNNGESIIRFNEHTR